MDTGLLTVDPEQKGCLRRGLMGDLGLWDQGQKEDLEQRGQIRRGITVNQALRGQGQEGDMEDHWTK